MKVKKLIYCLFFIFPALIMGCSDEVTPTLDQTYRLGGKVVNSLTGEGIGKVIIGIKALNTPDSLLFIKDSLNSNANNAFLMEVISDSAGFYQWDWFLGCRKKELYKNIFAYKKGYMLWSYTNDSTAVVNQINEFTDELNIKLVPK